MTAERITEERITVLIPGGPDLRIGPNSRTHWGTKAKLVKRLRYDARDAIRAATRPEERERIAGRLPLILHIEARLAKGAQHMDDDNLIACVKPIRDQLAHELAIDDRHIHTGNVTQIRDPEQTGAIVLTLETVA